MKLRVLAILLLAALPVAARAQSTAAGVNRSVQVVKDYLVARDQHDAAAAFNLLSFAAKEDPLPMDLPSYQKQAKEMSRLPATFRSIAGALYFIFDVDDKSGYSYSLAAQARETPNLVRLHVTPDASTTGGAADLLVVVGIDPVDHREKILALQTLMRADPAMVKGARAKARAISCLSNLKQIGLAMLQYSQDHDEIFPDADKWMDELIPYIGKDAYRPILHCPGDPHKFSYSFNRAMSHQSLAVMRSPADTVIVFESTSGKWNQSDHGSTLLKKSRHNGVLNWCFGDGHCRAESDKKPFKIQTLSQITE